MRFKKEALLHIVGTVFGNYVCLKSWIYYYLVSLNEGIILCIYFTYLHFACSIRLICCFIYLVLSRRHFFFRPGAKIVTALSSQSIDHLPVCPRYAFSATIEPIRMQFKGQSISAVLRMLDHMK